MSYWKKQTINAPLFEDILWSRPESRHAAGKLLIIGGNAHSFHAVAEAYMAAQTAGVGVCRVILPDALKKVLPNAQQLFETCLFVPSTPSGSFAKKSLVDILQEAQWADCILLAGNIGHNSETSLVIEGLLEKVRQKIVITEDAFESINNVSLLSNHTDLAIVLSFSQLQKLAIKLHFEHAFRFSMSPQQIVHTLHLFTEKTPIIVITYMQGIFYISHHGNVITHTPKQPSDIWRVKTAATSSVFWLQNQAKPLEAIASSFFVKNIG